MSENNSALTILQKWGEIVTQPSFIFLIPDQKTPRTFVGLALTIWGGWHLIGGIISLAITLPTIDILEKANVRKIKSA